jgi:tetratricopeptide (TPR) repeat protein
MNLSWAASGTPKRGGGRWTLPLMTLLAAVSVSEPRNGSAQQVAQPLARWMDDGALAMRKGNPQEAEKDFRHALALDPASADAYLGIGMAQLREGSAEKAAASLARASELKPEMLSAHMFRGIALFQMNSLDAARNELKEEVTLQPKSAEALTWLGIIDLQAGKPGEAAAALDRAGELVPHDQNILYYRVRAHTLSAQEAFRALFKIDPDSAFVHRAQAEIYSESEQPDKAIAEYQAALKRNPSDPELYEALGNEEQKVSHPADATSAYQSELALTANNPIALFNLGKMQVETGDPEQGVKLLERAVEAHASPAPTYFYLGFGLAKLGRNQEASEWLERALASSPSDHIRQSGYYELARVYQKLNRKADAQRALEELKRLKAQTAPANEQPK